MQTCPEKRGSKFTAGIIVHELAAIKRIPVAAQRIPMAALHPLARIVLRSGPVRFARTGTRKSESQRNAGSAPRRRIRRKDDVERLPSGAEVRDPRLSFLRDRGE